MFQVKVVEKVKTHISCLMVCSPHRRGRPQVIIRRMRFACCVTKATKTHSYCVQYAMLSHRNNGYMNIPECYVIHTLSVLCTLLVNLVCIYIACNKFSTSSVPNVD